MRLQAIARGRAVRRRTRKLFKSLPSNDKMKSEVYDMRGPAAASSAVHQDSKEKRCFRDEVDLEEKETRVCLMLRVYIFIQLLASFAEKSFLSFLGLQLRCNSQRYWNDSALSQEDINAVLLRKHDAVARRERMLKYSYSHRVNQPLSHLLSHDA